ncbi:hypothetical protein C5167_043254 [Papaver somniferum]|uniref:Uncharacterized protein n=1 Tax=Papaver somniferum TaxID=3469 RepID=A0A4Y7L7Q3_PAPSO|nr:hypothetical protein C5167_043254 [Papaver somniferum]
METVKYDNSVEFASGVHPNLGLMISILASDLVVIKQ